MNKRRQSIRIPVATVAYISSHGPQSTTKVMVRDLSITGMGCSAEHTYQEGDMLLVKIKLTTSNNEIIQESLTGRVAWASQLYTKQWAFGLEFQEVEKNNPGLYKYIKNLEKIADSS
ncbi:PilZ domain-containing protein [Nitrospira defluvii]|nr:PilZ domain-containing protein [Nitrospira defluvii]